MRFVKMILAVAVLAGWTGAGWAVCDNPGLITVDNVTVTSATDYDPFSDANLRINASVRISNGAATVCDNVQLAFVFATGAPRLSAAGSPDWMDVQVTAKDGNTNLIAASLTNATQRIMVGTVAAKSGGANGEAMVDFDVLIAPASAANGVVADGAYSLSSSVIDMVATSADVDSGDTRLGTKGDLGVSAAVAKLLDINLDATNYNSGNLAAYAMDLGTLSNGVTGSVGVQLRANVPHRLELSSANGGNMVGPDPATTYSVPYTVSIGGLSGASLAATQTLSYAEKTLRNGTALTLQVTIGDTGSVRAGIYKDTINLTVSGNP